MTDQDFRPIGWDFITAEYMRALPSGLDGLPLTSVPTVPLPEGHPDIDTWGDDMRDIARTGRLLWREAIWWRRTGDPSAPTPEVTDKELHTYNSTPGGSASALLTLGLHDFKELRADIARIGQVPA